MAMATLLLVASQLAQANLITNGGFETSDFTGWDYSGNLAVISDAQFRNQAGAIGLFPNGAFAVDFSNGNNPATGYLSQNLSLIPGQTYELSFDYGRLQPGSGGPQSLWVEVTNLADDQQLLNTVITDSSAQIDLAILLDQYTYRFFAADSSVKLSFSDISNGTLSTDGVFDNVTLSAVPLPPTAWFLLSGLGVFLFRYRKQACYSEASANDISPHPAY